MNRCYGISSTVVQRRKYCLRDCIPSHTHNCRFLALDAATLVPATPTRACEWREGRAEATQSYSQLPISCQVRACRFVRARVAKRARAWGL
eukprot:735880-Pleurochrysis_carterae.AAC.2